MLNVFKQQSIEANIAINFLRRIRPRAPWTLLTEGGRLPDVASFTPANLSQIEAARSWIVAAQRKGKGVFLLIGDTETPLHRPMTEEEIITSSILGLSFAGRPEDIKKQLAKLPKPSTLIMTGRAIAALYVMRTAIPMGTAAPILRHMSQLSQSQPAWLIPIPGTTRTSGHKARTIFHHPQILYTPAELSPKQTASTKEGRRGRTAIRANDIKAKPVSWLWKYMIPRGELTIIGGFGSAGKTTMCLGLAAAITRGAAWPDGTPAPSGHVMVIEGEDPVDTVTLPRLMASGADLSRVILIDQGQDMVTAQTLEEDAAGIDDLRMVILSPLRRLIHDNQTTNDEIRARLEPLIEWARKREAALIGIMHPQKGNKGQRADALAGSAAYTELSRSVHVAAIDESDPEPQEMLKRRVLVSGKTNIAPAGIRLGYRIETAHVQTEDELIETSRISWLIPGAADGAPTAPAAAPPKAPQAPVYATPAESWLAGQLATGPRPFPEIEAEGKAAGFSRATLYRAAKTLAVKRINNPDAPGVLWSRP